MTATYGAAEMVIAVRPCGVLRKIMCTIPTRPLFLTGPLHHLAYFCHRREAGQPPLIKLCPRGAIRLAKKDCSGPIRQSVLRAISYTPKHDRSGAVPLQHCV